MAGAAQATGNTLRMTVHRVLDDGDWSVAIATYTARRTTTDGEAHLENNLAHVARLEEGLIAESWLHSRDQYEVDEFWSARRDEIRRDPCRPVRSRHDQSARPGLDPRP